MLGELTDISILIIYCSHVKFVLCLASSLNKLGVYCPLYYVVIVVYGLHVTQTKLCLI